MVVPRLIERKRDGGALTSDEWAALIAGYTAGEIPDYQVSALLMAVMFRGLEPHELTALTNAMLDSGARLSRPESGPPRIDKHSTGGVGDKTSLVLAPLLAACGVHVPMMSGRGLGHTGGTLDKLESIPGFVTRMPLEQAARQLADIGVVMFGQSEEIVPADRKLYALRDVTGTVSSIPLITASIVSKKLAEQLDGLVLDVKVGSGAFITDPASSYTLARTMIDVAGRAGCRTVALLTAMDRPLGRTAGNSIEVIESIEMLRGVAAPDFREVTLALGVEMLMLAGGATDRPAARERLNSVLATGAALDKFRDIIEHQGGDPRVVDDVSLLPAAPVVLTVEADNAGRFPPLPPRELGELVVSMGGGRRVANDDVDPAVGLEILHRAGDQVSRGEPIAKIHARNDAQASEVRTQLSAIVAAAWQRDEQPLPLIIERIDASATGGS